jgi:hypothetical protein
MITIVLSRSIATAAAVLVGAALAVVLAVPAARAQEPVAEPAAPAPLVPQDPAGDPMPHYPIRGGRIVVPIWGCRGPAEPLPTPPPTPSPDPRPGGPAGLVYRPCPRLAARVPASVLQYALANPHAIRGYGELRNPAIPANPYNKYRTWLSLVDWGKPYSRCNSVAWTAGCS